MLMDAEPKPDFVFAMSYKVQSKKNYDNKILKLMVITAKTTNNNSKLKNSGNLHVVIPK